MELSKHLPSSKERQITDISSSRTTPALQPRKPPGVRWDHFRDLSGAVVYIVPNHKHLTDAVMGLLIESYATLTDSIKWQGDGPIEDHFTWLGRESLMLVVNVEEGQELLKTVLRDVVTELFDFMHKAGEMTVSFTVLHQKNTVGTGRIGIL